MNLPLKGVCEKSSGFFGWDFLRGELEKNTDILNSDVVCSVTDFLSLSFTL